MNYDIIENLVVQAKLGDEKAKELLVKEFTPFIINLSKKSFINSYELADIRSECYQTLFKCVNMYNPNKHRFVAYATNAIKNSVNYLIRTSVRRSCSESPTSFIIDEKLKNIPYPETDEIDDILLQRVHRSNLQAVIKNLSFREQEFINHIYFKGCSLKKYSDVKGIPYTTAVSMKTSILRKLKKKLSTSSYEHNNLN